MENDTSLDLANVKVDEREDLIFTVRKTTLIISFKILFVLLFLSRTGVR